MSIDLDFGIPFYPEEGVSGEDRRREERNARRIFLMGGAMNPLGGVMGPGYPMILDPFEEEEQDPNP